MKVAAPSEASSQRLARFEIHERLGGGAFGVVYRAFDPQLDREVALKIPLAGTLEKANAVQRFMREAKAAAQLRHPNIVPIYDAGRDGDQYYIASAFIAGQPLDDAVESGPLEPRRAARIVRELAEALDYAHNQGIVHRDIKPANVMLDEKDHPHVMDFGLARLDASTSKLTRDGSVMGTPAYMSPEQAAGQNDKVNATSDQYSLGVLFYELLTGQTPFNGPPHVVIVNILKMPTPAPRSINAKIPRDLETICLKAVTKDSERRYATCHEFAEDLRRWLDGESITARRVGPVERLVRWCQRNPLVSALTVTAAVLLIAITGISSFAAVRLKRLADSERSQIQRANDLAKKERAARQASDQNAADAVRQTRAAEQNLFVAHMNLAQAAWEDGRGTTTIQLLERWRPKDPSHRPEPTSIPAKLQSSEEDVRGFEWYYLNRLAHSELFKFDGRLPTSSPNGELIASRYQLGGINIHESSNGRLITSLKAHSCSLPFQTIRFDTRGTVLISANAGQRRAEDESEIKVWQTSDWKEVSASNIKCGMIRCVDISPDGKIAATVATTGDLSLWDISNGARLGILKSQTGSTEWCGFNPDGKQVVSCGADVIRVWDVATQKETNTLSVNYCGRIVFGPDGKHLAGLISSGTIKTWDLTTNRETLQFGGNSSRINGVAYTPDGLRIISVNHDSTVKLWDGSNGYELHSFKTPCGQSQFTSVSSDGRRILTGGYDNSVYCWDVTATRPSHVLSLRNDEVRDVAFSPDGTSLSTIRRSSNIRIEIRNSATGQSLHAIDSDVLTSSDLILSPDGKQVASIDKDLTIKVMSTATGELISKLKGLTHRVNSMDFSPDGSQIATCDIGESIRVWNVMAPHKELFIKNIPDAQNLNKAAVSPNGRFLAVSVTKAKGEAPNMIAHVATHIWDLSTQRECFILHNESMNGGMTNCVTFSPDSKAVFIANLIGSLTLWNAQTGQLIFESGPYLQSARAARFSPDGKRIAVAMANQIKLYDASTGLELLTLNGQNGDVVDLEFSRDGYRLASVGNDLRIWDARPWTPELKLEQQAGNLVRQLFQQGQSPDSVLKAIQSDRSIPDAVRRKAVSLLQ